MKVQFSLSDKAILNYLTQNQEKSKKQEIGVAVSDLSDEQIKLLTATTNIVEAREGALTLKFKTNTFRYNIDGGEFVVELGEFGSTDIKEILVEVQETITAAHEKHIEYVAKKKKEEDERVAEETTRKLFNDQNIRLFLQGKDAQFKTSPYDTYFWKGEKSKVDSYYFDTAYLTRMFTDLKEEIDSEITRRALVEEEHIKSEEKEKQAKESACREWALQYGSHLLVSRVLNGYEWKELAEEEWLQATYPELKKWADLNIRDYRAITKPDLIQIQTVEDFKVKYPGVVNPKMFDAEQYGSDESFTIIYGELQGPLTMLDVALLVG